MSAGLKTWLLVAFGFAVSALCIVAGILSINWTAALQAFARTRIDWVAAGALCNVLAFTSFAARWGATLARKPPLRLLFGYLMVGYMTNAVLPMRPGDLARAALLQNRHGMAFTSALSSVVVERTFDLLAVVGIGLFAATSFNLPQVVLTGLMGLALLAIGLFAALFALSHQHALAVKARGLVARLAPAPLVAIVRDRAQAFIEGVRVLHGFRSFVAISALTLLGWVFTALSIHCFLRAVSIDVPWFAAAIVVVITGLGSAIPSSPGALGVYHALVVFALSLFGVPASIGVAAALVAHTTSILLQIGLGAASSAALGVHALQVSTNANAASR